MVKWIGKFSLLLNRPRDARMDMLPMTATSEEVTTHGRIYPFSDNLTMLLFIVASDLSEAQRERLKSSFSLKGVSDTAYTFEAVRTVSVEFVLYAEKLNGESLTAIGQTRAAARTEPSS